MRTRAAGLFTSAALLIGSLPAIAAPALVYPPAPVQPVTDTYFATAVEDPYQYLEDPAAPETKAFATAETSLALGYLKSQPTFPVYSARLAELAKTSTQRFGLVIAGGRDFYNRETPPEAQSTLIVRDGFNAPERVLFDPQQHLVGGVAPSIESRYVSPDGSKVAFTQQFGGSEDESLYVVDATTGTILPDTIPHCGGGTSPTAVAWDRDGKGFLHTAFANNADGTHATSGILIYHHVLGTDASTDTYVFGKDQPAKVEYAMVTSPTTDAQAIAAADGDGPHDSVFVRYGAGSFVQVADPSDGIGDSAAFPGEFEGDSLDVVSKKREPRGEVVSIAPGKSFDSATIVVPASGNVLERIVPLPAGRIIALGVDGGDGEARIFGSDGKLVRELPVPKISTVTTAAADPVTAGPIVFGYANYTTPDRWLQFDPATGATSETGIATSAVGDYSNVVAERVFVPSLDGTANIPLEIVRMKSTPLDGKAMTIMTAYGMYGVITRPGFNKFMLGWLERGGIFAQAMVRGGGEYGESWHLAAQHATKPKSSDDLESCGEWLTAHNYTSPKHLGIVGGSAGGFLMGLALTRNPDSYGAVLGAVGIYDTLRFELTPNGAFNTPEFGTVKDPAQFGWMYAQSPYAHVVAGRKYPAVMFETGENDPRVDPYNSRKMIALLQADASKDSGPLLLVQRAGQGHGIGNSFAQQIEGRVDEFVFFESALK